MSDIREICNLSDEEFATRSLELRNGLMQKVRTRKELADGFALSFDATTALREELEELVAFESRCCASLEWSVRHDRDTLQLEIRGLDPSSDLFASLAAMGESGPANARERKPSAGPGLRGLLRSLGLGGVLSITLCCVLPFGVAMVAGVGIAAPLGVLDNPWVIAGVGLGFAAILTLRERRRAAVRAAATDSAGCGC